jgi:hypothetical protein
LAEKTFQNNKLEKGLHTSVMVERGNIAHDGISSSRMVPINNSTTANRANTTSSTQNQVPSPNTNSESNAPKNKAMRGAASILAKFSQIGK